MDRFKDKFSKGMEMAKEKMNKASEATKEKIEGLKLQEKMGAAKDKVGQFKEQVGLGKVYEINGHRYKSKKLVGEGGFGYVYLVQDIDTGSNYALKQILVSTKEAMESAKHEINIMKSLPSHKNLVRLIDATSMRSQKTGGYEFYMVMEFCPGSVVDLMNARLPGRFSEEEIWSIFNDVCVGVEYLHNRDEPIAHRDLKVENVLQGNDGSWKLCDFGSCTTRTYKPENERDRNIVEEDVQKNTTMAYRAPEMIDLYRKQLINEKVDIWALGVMLYKLAFFVHPFDEESPLGILNMRYEIPPDSPFSENLHKMIQFLLVADPAQRPDIFTVLSKLATLRHQKYERKTPAKKTPQTPSVTISEPEFKSPPTPSKSSATPTSAKLFDILDWQDSDSQQVPPSPSQYSQPSQASSSSTIIDNDFLNVNTQQPKRASVDRDIPEYPPVSDPDSDIFPHLDTSPSHLRTSSDFHHLRTSTDSHHLRSSTDSLRTSSDSLHHLRTTSDTSFNHSHNHSRNSSDLSDFEDLEFSEESEDHHKRNVNILQRLDYWAKVTFSSGQKSHFIKATSEVTSQPKAKHVRRVIVEAWEGQKKDASKLFEYLRSRPLHKDPVVTLKSFILIHKLIQSGPPEIILHAHTNLAYLEDVRDHWMDVKQYAETSQDREFANLVGVYASFVIKKILFHYENAAFEGLYSLEAASRNSNQNFSQIFNVNVLGELITIYKMIVYIPPLIFNENPMDDCKLGCLYPLAKEGQAIFTIILFILCKLNEVGDISEYLQGFLGMYNQLNDFFNKTRQLQHRLQVIDIPTLPEQCPKPSAGLKVSYPPTMNPHLIPEGGSPPSDRSNSPMDLRNSGSKQPSQQGPVLAKPPASPRSKDPNVQQQQQRTQQFMQQQFQQFSLNNSNNPSPPQQTKQPMGQPMGPPMGTSKTLTAEEKLQNTEQNEKHLKVLKQLLALPENTRCADCGRKDPSWASINLGIFICLSCSGIHRSLGTHISKVRSCTLDTWESQSIENMKNMGNARAKAIWEARVPNGYPIPNESDPQNVIKKWITAKYEYKEFMAPDPKAAIASIPSSGSKLLQQQQRPQGNYNLNQPYMQQPQMQYQHSFPGASSPYNNYHHQQQQQQQQQQFNNYNNNSGANFNNNPNNFQANFDPFAANQNSNNWNQQNQQQQQQNNFFF